MRHILTAAMLLLPSAICAQTATAPIQPEAIKEDVRVLSSDAFQGRGPGERGETMTLAYLKEQFEAAGLQPGGRDGSWFQEVPLIRLDKGAAAFDVTAAGERIATARARDFSIAPSHEGTATVTDAPVVFAGFGIHAPALGWDDYAGADVRGKIVLILPNDPDFDQPSGSFGGRQRSRYAGGKASAAFERGAVGVIQIHRQALTSWPWQQLWNSDPNPTFRLASAPTPSGTPRVTGYVSGDLAAAMLSRAGLNLETLIKQAQQPGFRAVGVPGVSVTASATATASPMTTRNFVAKLEGTTRAGETVVFGAHWDGYGAGPADSTGDTIRNGAVDNAVGTATMLDVARAFARGPRPQRTLLFIGYTSEEDGLLGAYHYVANPIRPLETTAAVFNLDPHLALPATRSIELIGAGRVDLEDDLARLAKAQGRRIEPEVAPEAGWYQRSDHYAFAQAGVPSLYFRAGRDLAGGGRADAVVEQYNSQCYHQRCDEFQESWDMAAAAQDGALVHGLASEIANSARWPAWRADSDFAAARAKSDPDRRR
ncbi:M28 family peptidase [Sphingomonas qomolangmaensis]|uniref:M28 family peptidase n=1 Tax=Sphingomonas qomolangmaensis TaxID=2918765 RepID=A0ABY5LE81_9SPHN|nr:M28 family peptidase [Sphingomonas qomolangmaensis]UUL84003.1 M28 family peptidase [Sphingomonas qomolangmaensis]